MLLLLFMAATECYIGKNSFIQQIFSEPLLGTTLGVRDCISDEKDPCPGGPDRPHRVKNEPNKLSGILEHNYYFKKKRKRRTRQKDQGFQQ